MGDFMEGRKEEQTGSGRLGAHARRGNNQAGVVFSGAGAGD